MKRLAAILAVAFGALVFSASAANAEVYWKQIDGPLEAKPTELTTSWGTSSSTIYFKDLEWRGWGSPRAEASGKAMLNTCDPYCLAGNYITVPAKVWLTNIRIICNGIDRYMHIRVAYRYKGKWYGENYDDVTCQGVMNNPTGNPFPNLTPKPRPKPRLKLVTAKSLFNRTVKDRLPEGGKGKRYLRCYRVARLRVRCRGKWVQSAGYDLGTAILPFKVKGFVQRNGRSYRVKIRAKYWNVYDNGLPTGGPYYFTEWGFYVLR